MIALFWYGSQDIEKTGFKTLQSYIVDYSIKHYWELYWLPLIFAMGYSVGMPVLKNALRVLYAKLDSIGESAALKYSKYGNVPMTKYLSFRENYIARTENLEKIIKSENSTIQLLEKEKTLRLEALGEKNELTIQINGLNEKIRDITTLHKITGTWRSTFNYQVTMDGSVNTISGEEFLEITIDGSYAVLTKNEARIVFKIIHFSYNAQDGTVFFIKQRMIPPEGLIDPNPSQIVYKHLVNELILHNGNLMTGRENGVINIRYERVTLDEINRQNN